MNQDKYDAGISALANLHRYLLSHGPVNCVRVSSAHAQGRARKYPYWGLAEYTLCVGRKGSPCLLADGAAPSSRRSYDLAVRDAEATGLLEVNRTQGYITEDYAEVLLEALGVRKEVRP